MSITKTKKLMILLTVSMVISMIFSVPAFAAATNTDVSGLVVTAFGTYMKPQIKDFANNLLIPLACGIDLVILIIKALMSYSSYKSNGGRYEWHALAVLGGCLVIGGTAPLWIWGLIRW